MTGSRTTYPIPATQTEKLKLPPKQCSTDPAAQHSNMLGYDVARNVKEFNAGKSLRVESWRAPDLGCIALLEKIYEINGDQEELKDTRLLPAFNPVSPIERYSIYLPITLNEHPAR